MLDRTTPMVIPEKPGWGNMLDRTRPMQREKRISFTMMGARSRGGAVNGSRVKYTAVVTRTALFPSSTNTTDFWTEITKPLYCYVYI